jgi:hypothetical protein
MTIEEFINKYCKECKENCEKGIRETTEFIYCVDANIKEKTNNNY